MSLREELQRQIRYTLSADRLAVEAFTTGKAPGASTEETFILMATWINGVQDALFTLADKVEALEAEMPPRQTLL